MPSHNILSKTDRAIMAYLISADAGTDADVFPAKLSIDKDLPCTVCFSDRAEWNGSGWLVSSAVSVRTAAGIDVDQSATEPKDLSEERVGKTFDAIMTGIDDSGQGHELGELITTAARNSGDSDLSDFTIETVNIKGVEAGFEGKVSCWLDTFTLELLVVPRDVS